MFEALKQRLWVSEGKVPHLYLDTLGLVTCGVGHMVPSAEAMQEVEMVGGDEGIVGMDAKVREWAIVKSLKPAMLPSYYAAHTSLRMTPKAIDELQNEDMLGFYNGLCHVFEDFPQLPLPAQEGVMDMAFQLGVQGLVGKFPKFTQSIHQHDWETAQKECYRVGIAQWRNDLTKALFLQAEQETKGD